MNCAWGKKAFAGYLGADQEKWKVRRVVRNVIRVVAVQVEQRLRSDTLTRVRIVP
jgi:S-formylglutathione hydrolase FrmB